MSHSTDRIHRWLREPLLQFLLVGACLLLAQRLFAPTVNSAVGGREIINVSGGQIAALDEGFRKAMGRAPTPAESRDLLERWLDEEAMFREGQKLGIDRTDAIVRRELQQKMRYLMEDLSPVPEPTETDLAGWLAKYPQRYGRPGMISFEQVFFGRVRHGDAAMSEAQTLLNALRMQPDTPTKAGDPFPGGSLWADQDEVALRRNFGGEFAVAVSSLPEGEWSGPVRSSLGLHLVRVTARSAFHPVPLSEVRERVLVDWRVAQRERLNREAVQKLRSRYSVLVDGVAMDGKTIP